MFVGCSYQTSICPVFPEPSQKVLDSLKDLNDKDIDSWVVELYKLNKKLKFCIGE